MHHRPIVEKYTQIGKAMRVSEVVLHYRRMPTEAVLIKKNTHKKGTPTAYGKMTSVTLSRKCRFLEIFVEAAIFVDTQNLVTHMSVVALFMTIPVNLKTALMICIDLGGSGSAIWCVQQSMASNHRVTMKIR